MTTLFPSTLDAWGEVTDNVDNVYAFHFNDLMDAIEACEAKLGCDSDATTTSFDWKASAFFVGGRILYTYEDTAPTGWTAVALYDKVLALKGATASVGFGTTGGSTAGVWGTTDLTADDAHAHTFQSGTATIAYSLGMDDIRVAHPDHYHTGTLGAPSTHSHTGDGSWRPPAAVGILIEKDT